MGDSRISLQDSHLASRKAEEAAFRRFQAVEWLQTMVGSLGLPSRPSEQEFVSCLKNGLVLCNTINKIQPGAVPKVVENHVPLFPSELQPFPAYQYFENVRNFLVAVEDLKLPSFEASDLDRVSREGFGEYRATYFQKVCTTICGAERFCNLLWLEIQQFSVREAGRSIDQTGKILYGILRKFLPKLGGIINFKKLLEAGSTAKTVDCVLGLKDTFEAGSTAKIADCVLGLKAYHEWKQCGGYGPWKYATATVRSPCIQHSARQFNSHAATKSSDVLKRHLNMSAYENRLTDETANGKFLSTQDASQNHQDSVDLLVKILSEFCFNTKENIDQNLLNSFECGNMDPIRLFNKLVSSCLQEHRLEKLPPLKSILKEVLTKGNVPYANPPLESMSNASDFENYKGCRKCLKKGNCIHWRLLESQEKEITDLKALLLRTRKDFESLQFQLQTDLMKFGSQVQELSIAAAGYHQVVKENRDLYNTLQDLKGNIRVFCRIRPCFNVGSAIRSSIDFIGEDGSLIIVDPLKPQMDSRKSFQFNRVFGPTATQKEVYADTQPLIRSVMDGYNVCIFAYGQTGSGKTHTMCGPYNRSYDDLGINYLALDDLFRISRNRKDYIKYEVQVQMVEIYNEQVRDILATDASATKLEIRNCSSTNGFAVPDASMHLVRSTVDIINLMDLGEKNRAVSATTINNRSSRSHSVLTVHVQGTDTYGNIIHSCLHLVDLAGSERVDKSEVRGERLKEAQHINKSLSCLGDVIAALAQKNSHIPYRNSKLTQLLQDSLGGHAKSLMFAHVSPEADSYAETISTLKFAERVSTIELGAARLNKERAEVRELKEQIASLKKALAKKEDEGLQRPNESRSPLGNPKFKTELTPPSRRMSIEVPNIIKVEQAKNSKASREPIERTPPCLRRLSSEGPNHVSNSENKKEPGSQLVRPKFKAENSPICPRGLSLEGTKCRKTSQQPDQKPEDVQAISTNSSVEEQSLLCASSRAVWVDGCEFGECRVPVASFFDENCKSNLYCQNQTIKTENKARAPRQLPKTPETPMLGKRGSQLTKQSEAVCAAKSQIPSISNSSRKGSHIRKSLQTIGKLINGSEKRNNHQVSPVYANKGNTNGNDGKLPVVSNATALRRQSLTGVRASELDLGRRASLGGRSTDSYPNENRNALTPPPVHPSVKTAKRWL